MSSKLESKDAPQKVQFLGTIKKPDLASLFLRYKTQSGRNPPQIPLHIHFATNRFTFEKFPPPPPLLHPTYCIYSVIWSQSLILISLFSFQQNVVKET